MYIYIYIAKVLNNIIDWCSKKQTKIKTYKRGILKNFV